MHRNSFLASIAIGAITLASTTLQSAPAQARATSEFFCGQSQGIPTTMARTAKGDVAVIRFKSEHFSSTGWTPQRRCEEVSQRFNRFNQAGTLQFLTTGRMNGYNVVCVATERGGSCLEDSLLFTLRPGRNPGRTLQDLVTLRDRDTSPLNETTSRVYISIDQLLQQVAPERASAPRTSAPLPKPRGW